MEFVLGVLVSSILVGMWLVGSRRQREADGEQRVVLAQLEGARVSADVVVGLAPATRGVQLVATATFLLGALEDGGSRVRVSGVHVSKATGQDAEVVAAGLERDGLDVRDIVSVTGPDGEHHDFDTMQASRKGGSRR